MTTTIPNSKTVPTAQYFDPPTDPFWNKLHHSLLPFVADNDRIINRIQAFFGVKYRCNIKDYFRSTPSNSKQQPQLTTPTSSSPSQSIIYPQHDADNSHPLFSPIRGPVPIHIMMSLASELGNELFYGTWFVLIVVSWDLHTSIPLLLLWALSLGSAQFIKDKVRLPRPGCQYYNPRSPKYNKPVPNDEYVHRIETHYAAEFGLPSAHSCGAILALFNLYCLWNNYTHLVHDPTITPFLQGSTGFMSLSTLTTIVVHFSCIFWLVLTPISRLYFGVHSLLDVISGLTIALICMGVVIVLDWVGAIGFMLHNLIGMSLLVTFSVVFCTLYPKHDHLWTNSSGDTALIFGSMTGAVIVSYCINLWTNFTQNNAASLFSALGSFHLLSFFSPPPQNILTIATSLTSSPNINLESLQLATSLQRCAEILQQTSCSYNNNLWETFSLMTASSASFKKLIKLCPDLFAHYSEYAPVSQLLLTMNSSTNNSSNTIDVAAALTHGQFISPSTLNPFPYGLLSPPFLFPVPTLGNMSIKDILSNTDGVLASVLLGCLLVFFRALFALILGYLTRDLVFRKPLFRLCRVLLGFPAKPPIYKDTNDDDDVKEDKESDTVDAMTNNNIISTTSNTNNKKKNDKEMNNNNNNNATLTHRKNNTTTESQQKQEKEPSTIKPPIAWAGPPKSSTLFRFTHDMSIRDINIVDMVDKWVGYALMTFCVLGLYNILLDDFFELKYFLYIP